MKRGGGGKTKGKKGFPRAIMNRAGCFNRK